MPKLKKEDLESEITENKYEKDYNAKNSTTPLTIEGTDYKLKTEQYKNLMQILEKTETQIDKIKEFTESHIIFIKYFGIEIENESITGLQISDYELNTMPKEITQLTELQKLYLYNNQLSELPNSISKLTKLQELYLGYNQLSELPNSITQLTNLQTLYLNANQLKDLPDNFTQLTNLKTLNLNNNQLSKLQKEIQQLKQKGVNVYI
jgi:Leucine-rich repeat (LRR) protein